MARGKGSQKAKQKKKDKKSNTKAQPKSIAVVEDQVDNQVISSLSEAIETEVKDETDKGANGVEEIVEKVVDISPQEAEDKLDQTEKPHVNIEPVEQIAPMQTDMSIETNQLSQDLNETVEEEGAIQTNIVESESRTELEGESVSEPIIEPEAEIKAHIETSTGIELKDAQEPISVNNVVDEIQSDFIINDDPQNEAQDASDINGDLLINDQVEIDLQEEPILRDELAHQHCEEIQIKTNQLEDAETAVERSLPDEGDNSGAVECLVPEEAGFSGVNNDISVIESSIPEVTEHATQMMNDDQMKRLSMHWDSEATNELMPWEQPEVKPSHQTEPQLATQEPDNLQEINSTEAELSENLAQVTERELANNDDDIHTKSNVSVDIVQNKTSFFADYSTDAVMPWDETVQKDSVGDSFGADAQLSVPEQFTDKNTGVLIIDTAAEQRAEEETSEKLNEEQHTDDKLTITDNLGLIAKEDEDFLAALSKQASSSGNLEHAAKSTFLDEISGHSGGSTVTPEANINSIETEEDKFGFLEEDDNLLLDDIMDDDLLDDGDLIEATETGFENSIDISPDETSNTVIVNKTTKYAPVIDKPPSETQHNVHLLQKPSGPQFISSPPTMFNSPQISGLQPPVRAVKELTQAKKKSDAYDFPQALLEKKKHKPAKEAKENIYTRIEKSLESSPSTPPIPSQHVVKPNPYAQQTGATAKVNYSPSMAPPAQPMAPPNPRFARSNSSTSNKSASFFAELPVKIDSSPKVYKKNPYERIESQSSINKSASPLSPQVSSSRVASYAPVSNQYAVSTSSGANSFAKSNITPNPPKKASNPYAPKEVGGHIRNQSKTVDPNEIKANLIPVPGNKLSISTGSNNAFNVQQTQQPTLFSPVQTNMLPNNQISSAQQPEIGGKYTPYSPASFQPSNQASALNPYSPTTGLPPQNQKKTSISKTRTNRQSISSINEVYGSNIVTSAATSTGKRKTVALPPHPGKGKHLTSIAHSQTFTAAPTVINPENLVRRQWPLFSFSAQNNVASMIPSFDGYGHTICSIKVGDIGKILKQDTHIKTFPGPLVKGKTKTKDLIAWLDAKLSAMDTSGGFFTDVEQLTWKCLKHMLSTIHNAGDFSSPEYIKGICSIINPALNTSGGMNSTIDPISLANITNTVVHQKPHNAYRLDMNEMSIIHSMLEIGDKKSALEFSVRGGDWAMALLISNLMGPEAFNQVTKLYCSQILDTEKLGQDLSFFLQSNKSLTAASLSGKERWIVENYKVVIPFIMMDTVDYSKALTAVGDVLVLSGNSAYGKLSYMLSGLPIVPQNLSDNPSSIYAMIIEEIYEYILLSSGNVLPNFVNGFPHMIPVKISHAGFLADTGLSVEAKKYSDFTQSIILSKKMFCEPATLAAQKCIYERLSQVDSGWLSSKLSRPQLDRVWTTLDKSFNKFVAGEEIPQVEQKTEGVFSKFTPPVDLSRASSSLDLSDVKRHMSGSGLNLVNSARISPEFHGNSSNLAASPYPLSVQVPNTRELHNNYASELNLPSSSLRPQKGKYAPILANSSPNVVVADLVSTAGNVSSPPSNQFSRLESSAHLSKPPYTVASTTDVSNTSVNAQNTANYELHANRQPPGNTYGAEALADYSLPNMNEKTDDANGPLEKMADVDVKSTDSRLSENAFVENQRTPLPPSSTKTSLKKKTTPPKRSTVNRYAPVDINKIQQGDILQMPSADISSNHTANHVVPPHPVVVPPQLNVVTSQPNVIPPQPNVIPPQPNVVPPQPNVVPPQPTVVTPQPNEVPPQQNIVHSQPSSFVLPQLDASGSVPLQVDISMSGTAISTEKEENEQNITESTKLEKGSENDVEFVVEESATQADSQQGVFDEQEMVNNDLMLSNENLMRNSTVTEVNEKAEPDLDAAVDGTFEKVDTEQLENLNHLDKEDVIPTEAASLNQNSPSDVTDDTKEVISQTPPAASSFKPNTARAISRSVNRYGPASSAGNKSKPKPKNPYAPSAQAKEHKKSAYAPSAPSASAESNDDSSFMIPADAGPVDMFSFGGYSVPEPTQISPTEVNESQDDQAQTDSPEIQTKDEDLNVENSVDPEDVIDMPVEDESFSENKSDSTFVPTFIPHTQAGMRSKKIPEPVNTRTIQNMFTPPTPFAELNNTRKMSSPIHQFTEEKRYQAVDTGEYYDDVVDDSDEEDENSTTDAQKKKKEEEERLAAEAAALEKKKEEEARKQKEKEDEEKKKKNEKVEGGSRWFGWIGKGKNDDKPKPIKAKLGEENSFYYDEKLKRWINKKAPLEEQLEASKPPPPPAMKKPAASTTPALSASGSPPAIKSSPSPLAPPPGINAPGMNAPKPIKKDSIDDLLSLGASASAGTGRRTARRGPRRGYVDVMGNQ